MAIATRRLTIAALLLAVLLPAAAAEPLAIYVAPEGNDAWSGRLAERNPAGTDGPLATIGRAQQVVRQLRAAGKTPQPINVLLRGVHRLAAPVVFTPEDSGSEQAPITYAAPSGQRPVLSGGRIITGWKKGPGEVWTVELPEVRAGKWYFRQLFVDQRRACRARSPNEGFLRVQGLVDAKPGAPWNQGVDRFRFRPGDLKAWSNLQDVEVIVWHSWNTSRVRVAEIDAAKSVVRFTGPTVFRPLAWDPAQRYQVENARELLDSPGEWYLDRPSGVLSYWPLAGQDMTKAEVVAPVLEELVRFDGDPDKGRFVEHVRLVGLSLQHADWTLPDKGYGDPQAAVTVPAVVSARGARHVTIQQCEIAHVGTYGLWFSRGCKHNRIAQNHIHDLGAGAVRIGEATRPRSDQTESSHNVVTNNYLHDGGCVYPGAVGVWLAQASHNEISHNEIHSFDYTGISVGWNWDFSPNRTSHNRIEQNHVHHVVRGMLSDAGGIYTLGVQTGTVIRGNVFHDIFPYAGSPAMAWGIYFDQGSSGLVVENNVVYHTLTGGLMGATSPGTVVRNNVFALSAWQAVWRWAWQKEPAITVERNIFYLTQGELFHADGGSSDFKSKWDNNVYWRADGRPLDFYEETFPEWQAHGVDRHSLVADPQFVDPAHFDFRLRPGSPALKLGIQSIDTSRVGLFGPAEWVNLPKQAQFAPTMLPKPPAASEPTPINDDFEETPVGQSPALAKLFEEGSGDSIRVTDETAASGKHSLKLTDAPGLKHAFNPHLFYSPHFREGRAVLSFDLRREKDAVLAHEWRDAAHPYRVGPSLMVDAAGKLRTGGKALADVPQGVWCHVEIVCELGKRATGTYELTLTVPGRPAQTFRAIPCGATKFNRIEWLGFTSLATTKTAAYLDNIKLSLVPSGK